MLSDRGAAAHRLFGRSWPATDRLRCLLAAIEADLEERAGPYSRANMTDDRFWAKFRAWRGDQT